MSPSNEQQKRNKTRRRSPTTTINTRSSYCCLLWHCSTSQESVTISQEVKKLTRLDLTLISNPSPTRDQEFVVRLTPNGRIIDCDERVKGILELLPQDMIGTSLYDHLHSNDIPRIVEVSVFRLIPDQQH